LLFSLGGLLNAFAHCLSEKDLPSKSGAQVPVSISCLDNQENPFLAQVDQRDKSIPFSKIENRPADTRYKALLLEEASYLAPLRLPASILVSLSVPIYQFKNVYQI
jgi:hypothetical protein